MEEQEEYEDDESEEGCCAWCGDTPTYIGVYEDDSYENEIFLCKSCYEEEYS